MIFSSKARAGAPLYGRLLALPPNARKGLSGSNTLAYFATEKKSFITLT